LPPPPHSLLQDWNDGRIPYFTVPPKRSTEVAGSAQFVNSWGADFDAASLDQSAALAGLAGMEDGGGGAGGRAFFQADTLGAVQVDLEGMAAAAEGGGEQKGSSSEEEEDLDAGGP
jgi:nuclear GTP-binding protein